jgi:transposase-like protein
MTDRPSAGARRAGLRAVDWRHAAELLAQGLPVATVARQVGCSRSQLSRKRNRNPAFRRLIEQLENPAAERDRISDLRAAVHAAIEAEVRKSNVRVILWLADRLKLITPPSERTPGQELQAILRGLSADELREFESLGDNP